MTLTSARGSLDSDKALIDSESYNVLAANQHHLLLSALTHDHWKLDEDMSKIYHLGNSGIRFEHR